MIEVSSILLLHDLDLMRAEAGDAASQSRLRRMGLGMQEGPLERTRTKLLAGMDRRWLNHYERALRRYGRAVALVRDRICQGCFITLPTSAAPAADESLTLCESCGRILYWGGVR